MNPVVFELTQGDPFYAEMEFVDAYGAGVDLTGWGISVGFRRSLSDAAPFLSLGIGTGITLVGETGVISMAAAASAFASISISPTPRNGDFLPFGTVYGDVKLTPPTGVNLVQGSGARTAILLKLYLAVTA